MPRRGLGFLGFAVPPASTAAACGGGVRRRRAAAAVSTGGEGDKGRSLLPVWPYLNFTRSLYPSKIWCYLYVLPPNFFLPLYPFKQNGM